MLDRLRSPGAQRPQVDPGLSGGLRAWLEDAIGAVGLDVRSHAPVVLGPPSSPPRGPVTGVATRRSTGSQGRGLDTDQLRLAVIRCLFRLAVTVGLGPRPFEDALAALSVGGTDGDVAAGLLRMGPAQRARLREETLAHAALIASQWRIAAPGWLPRTAETLRAPLGGGAVVLSATADLALGAPSSGLASVCLVRVAAHQAPGAAAADRAFLALLETLRSGAPPFRVATYHADGGRLEVDDITDTLLTDAVGTTVERVAAHRPARPTPAR